MYQSKITGVGHYLPEEVLTNNQLSEIMDTTDEWITERTGIKERRIYKENEDRVSTMGARAAYKALEMAGINKNEVDMIVFATLSPDYYFPGSGVLMQREMGINGIPAIDIRQQCSGFVYGISVADQYIKTGMCKKVLVVGSEIHTNAFEYTNRDRHVSVIFGDGAGCALLERAEEGEESAVLSTHIHSDGTHAEELAAKHPGSVSKIRCSNEMLEAGALLPNMNGQLVFKNAVQRFPEVIKEALEYNNLKPSDIDLLIPHQANLRISQFVQKLMRLGDDKIFNNIQKYGNTTAGSIPIALSEAVQEGKVKKGDLLCLAAFGSGFTWASTLVRW